MKTTTQTQVQNTKIAPCITGCSNDYQDRKHGAGMRVMNPKKRVGTNPQVYRCTVCGKEQ